METNLCQSCGMPLTKSEELATERDGSKNYEYCIYCYKEGRFTREVDMEGMIDICAGFLDEYNKDSGQKMSLEQAKAHMREFFPSLKRWKNG
ncbi:MAG: zinc ribbon domain-containing protein [Alistipes sp.]|nr:zinc ribbon domain-containing protein [Alistipes sp.]